MNSPFTRIDIPLHARAVPTISNPWSFDHQDPFQPRCSRVCVSPRVPRAIHSRRGKFFSPSGEKEEAQAVTKDPFVCGALLSSSRVNTAHRSTGARKRTKRHCRDNNRRLPVRARRACPVRPVIVVAVRGSSRQRIAERPGKPMISRMLYRSPRSL